MSITSLRKRSFERVFIQNAKLEDAKVRLQEANKAAEDLALRFEKEKVSKLLPQGKNKPTRLWMCFALSNDALGEKTQKRLDDARVKVFVAEAMIRNALEAHKSVGEEYGKLMAQAQSAGADTIKASVKLFELQHEAVEDLVAKTSVCTNALVYGVGAVPREELVQASVV